MPKCPKCGSRTRKDSEFCRKCGKHLIEKAGTCPECGSKIKKDAKFCRKCGTKIGGKTGLGSNLVIIVGALAVVLLIALILLAGLYFSGILQKNGVFKLELDSDKAICGGNLVYEAELTDHKGNPIQNAEINVIVGEETFEKLKTDQNGKLSSSKKIPPNWCGKSVNIEFSYGGSIFDKSLKKEKTISAKIPTKVTLSIPSNGIIDNDVKAEVTLMNSVDNTPIQSMTINISNNISQGVITDSQGKGTTYLKFPTRGTHNVKAKYSGDSTYLSSESSFSSIEIVPESCSDGTYVGECSEKSVGKHCGSSKQLVWNCTSCGCSGALTCYQDECMTEEQRTTKIVAEIQKSMVYVEHSYGTGSGVIIQHSDGKTIILTNKHVVEGANSVSDLTITTNSNQKITASDIKIDPNDMDLAIIYVNGKYGETVTAAYNYEQGQEVVALGSPLGLQGSVSDGIISNALGFFTDSYYPYTGIQTDAAINPGNSGGGLFLKSTGQLIGINSFAYVSESGAEGLGFAIDITTYFLLTDFDDWDSFTPVKKCSDGTAYGSCSYNYVGYICLNGQLIERCYVCGCPTGYYCSSSGTCFSCPSGYVAYEDDYGEGFCCPAGYTAYSNSISFCCPPGTTGYEGGYCY